MQPPLVSMRSYRSIRSIGQANSSPYKKRSTRSNMFDWLKETSYNGVAVASFV